MKKIAFLITILLVSTTIAQTNNETLGTNAGSSITTGDNNVVIGDESGTNITSSSNNAFLGYRSGYNQVNTTTASGNVFMGYEAGYNNINERDLTFIGFRAGYFYGDGSSSGATGDLTFIGTGAGFNLVDGDDVVFIGDGAGHHFTTGDDNTFVGSQAGGGPASSSISTTTLATSTPATGSDNTGIGSNALSDLTTGYRNTALGVMALNDVTTGYRNTAVGDSTGLDIGTGIYNSFFGQAAGAATEHADFNTFIGSRAGYDNNRTNDTGNANRNTYVGHEAGYTNREGEDNVVIGAFTDFLNTGEANSGSNGQNYNARNVLIGAAAQLDGGANTNFGGNDAVMIGYNSLADGARVIGLGSGVEVSGNDAVGLGYASQVSGVSSIGIGGNSTNQVEGAVTLGFQTTADATNATNGALYSMALGYQAQVSDSLAVAIGKSANASGKYSYAIGSNANALNDNTMVLGGAAHPLSVGIGTDTPNSFASLELSGVNKGLLLNRLTTTERNTLGGAIGTAEEGLMIYDTDEDTFYGWDGSQWKAFGSGASSSGPSAVPELLNYQAVIRDVSGNILANQTIVMQMSVLDNITSTTAYVETHSLTTSDHGSIELVIGNGVIQSGTFSAIDWSHSNSLQVEIDIDNTGSFALLGTSSFVSVPYALRAKYAENLSEASSSRNSAANTEKDIRIESLEKEVAELKQMLKELLNKQD